MKNYSNNTQQSNLVPESSRDTENNWANVRNLELGTRSSSENRSLGADANDNPPNYEMACDDENLKDMTKCSESEDVPSPSYEVALYI